MDRDNSPSPSPRPQPFTSSLFTSPPFTSTLPLPHPLTRPNSDSFLQNVQRPTSNIFGAHRYQRGNTRRQRRTRSANSSVHSESESESNPDLSIMSSRSLDDLPNAQIRHANPQLDPAYSREDDGEEKKDDGKPGQSDKTPKHNLSNYTIDLANLNHDSSGGRDLFAAVGASDYDIQVPVRPRDVVDSEDDGPEDFTVELGKWMRGTGPWKGKTEQNGTKASSHGAEKERDEVEEQKGGHETSGKGVEHMEKHEEAKKAPVNLRRASVEDAPEGDTLSVFQPPLVSTPMRSVGQNLNPQDAAEGALDVSTTPLVTPPQPRAQPERSSEEVFKQISLLQADVERLRVEAEELRAKKQAWDEERGHWVTENEQLVDDLEAERREVDRLQDVKEAQQQDMEDLKAKYVAVETTKQETAVQCEWLKTQHTTTQQELTTERANSANYASQCRAKDTELDSLRFDIARCKQDTADQQRASQAREQELLAQIEEFQGRLKDVTKASSESTSLRNELDNAQSQLTETRRILETVEDENDRLTQQNQRQEQELEALNLELVTAREAKTSPENSPSPSVEQLPTPPGDSDPWLQPEGNHVPDTSATDLQLADNLDSLTDHYESQLSTLRATHMAEVKKLKQTLLRAAEGMQKREAKLTKANAEEVAALKDQIATLKAAESKPSPRKEQIPPSNPQGAEAVAELRSAVRALSSKLKVSQTALAAAEQEAQTLRSEIQTLRDEAAESQRVHEVTNKALEAKFAKAVDERETEWERRIDLLLRDREKMGRVLMWGWGKEEVGERVVEVEGRKERRMGYQYRERREVKA